MEENEIVIGAKDLREKQKALNKEYWEFVDKCKATDTLSGVFKGEAIANAMLSYRHAEDSRMRLGKVLQATGSINPYDA